MTGPRAVAAVAAAGLLAACGIKAPPRPPDAAEAPAPSPTPSPSPTPTPRPTPTPTPTGVPGDAPRPQGLTS